MYWKLVYSTDFDALDGQMMLITEEIIAVVSASSRQNAKIMFEFLKKHDVISYSSSAEILTATEDEFLTFMNK